MATEKRYIEANAAMEELSTLYVMVTGLRAGKGVLKKYMEQYRESVLRIIDEQPTVDAVEVVHGRWERCGGDLHSSGYAIFCSVCNKVHFVHRRYSLGGLTDEELFEKPKYCPSCGAFMGVEE